MIRECRGRGRGWQLLWLCTAVLQAGSAQQPRGGRSDQYEVVLYAVLPTSTGVADQAEACLEHVDFLVPAPQHLV